jgi:hypothetical protein
MGFVDFAGAYQRNQVIRPEILDGYAAPGRSGFSVTVVGKVIVAIGGIGSESDAPLAQVAGAEGALRAALAAAEGREQQSREQRQDGNDHQEFHEGEAAPEADAPSVWSLIHLEESNSLTLRVSKRYETTASARSPVNVPG